VSAGTPGGSYHHGNLHQALIEAGIAALQDDADPGKISLRGLAGDVGVSPAAVYRHFPTKDAMMGAIAQAGHQAMEKLASSAALEELAEPDRRDRRRCLLYIQFARENPALFRLMFTGRIGVRMRKSLGDIPSNLNFFGECDAPGRSGGPSDAMKTWSIAHGIAHMALDGHLDALGAGVDELIHRLVQQLVPMNRPREADKAPARPAADSFTPSVD